MKNATKTTAPSGECGQMLDDAQFVFHPFLYCELYRLGHRNQGQWLADAGFVRAINVETQRKRADAAEKERDELRAAQHSATWTPQPENTK